MIFLAHLSYAYKTPTFPTDIPAKWDTNKTEWYKYRELVKLPSQYANFSSTTEACEHVTKQILESAKASIPLIELKTKKKCLLVEP